MSEIIEAYENLEKISKDKKIIFRVDKERNTYELEFVEKPVVSKEEYLAKVRYIRESWPFPSVSDIVDPEIPQKFLKDDRGLILTVGLGLSGIKNQISIDTLFIQRNYERSKELADYVLKILSSKRFV